MGECTGSGGGHTMDMILIESPQYYLEDPEAYAPGLERLADYARERGIPVRVPEGELVTYRAVGPPYPCRCEIVGEFFRGLDYGPYGGEDLEGSEVLVTGGAFHLERRLHRYSLGRVSELHGIGADRLKNFSDGGDLAFACGEVADLAFDVAHQARRVFVDGLSTVPRGEWAAIQEVYRYGHLSAGIGYLIVRDTGRVLPDDGRGSRRP